MYCKPRHKPRLRWGDALLQGPAVGLTSGSRLLAGPNTAIRALPPPSAVTRRREEAAVGRSLIP